MTFEHTHRELLPALLFLHEAEQAGFNWSLESIYQLGPGRGGHEVVVTPFLYDSSDYETFLRRHRLVGSTLVNLMYEQFNVANSVDYLVPDRGFAREEAVHCVWGERTRRLLLEHGLAEENIRVTGQPRFDIYHVPELLCDRETLAMRYQLDPAKQWVLLPYNFNVAYITHERVAALAARNFTITPEYISAAARARDVFTPMVRSLADEYPQIEFILRTHPSGMEAASIYEGETRERSNLRVIADLDIANWIRQASLIVVWTSSSGIEGMVAGVPVVALEPEPYADVFDYDVTRILPTVTTVDEVAALVEYGDRGELDYDWELFDHWFSHRGGETSRRLVDVIEEAVAEGPARAVRRLPPRPVKPRARGRANDLAEAGPEWIRPVLQRLGWNPAPSNLDVADKALRTAVAERRSEPILDALW